MQLKNQLTYKLLTHVNQNGEITLPKKLNKFYDKNVEIIIYIPKKTFQNKEFDFYDLIEKYNSIDEPELDTKTIISERNGNNTRKFIFD